jgi:hypothetical protein|tara:strand:- start:1071 stop:1313 length:243 start_codon:yes stop_codon:yes gene_type:complete
MDDNLPKRSGPWNIDLASLQAASDKLRKAEEELRIKEERAPIVRILIEEYEEHARKKDPLDDRIVTFGSFMYYLKKKYEE